MTGGAGFYLVRCTVCGREDRSGGAPVRDGWPTCCGYTMRLVETERFVANASREVSRAAAAARLEGDTE